MRHIIILIIATFSLSFVTLGQSLLSIRYPFGLPVQEVSGMGKSMGGASVGVENKSHVLLSNPANLGAIDKTAFSSLFTVNLTHTVENGLSKDEITSNPAQLSFAFPLGIIGTMGFAYSKETDANIRYQQDTASIDASNSYLGQLSYSRTGGTTAWQIGLGNEILNKIKIGVVYKRLYRIVNSTKIVDLIGYPDGSSRDSTCLQLVGNAFRFGILVPIKKITLGIVGDIYLSENLQSSGGIYRAETMEQVSEHPTDSTTCEYPPSIKAGVSYRPSNKLLLSADLGLVKWSMFDANPLIADVDVDNTVELSVGAQFIPAPDLLAPRYFETIRYRAGLNISQLPDDGSINLSASLGIGLPLKGGGLLDFILTYGNRSSDKYPNYTEHYAQLSIGVNGGRKWIRTSSEEIY